MTQVRITYASAAVLICVGLFMIVRSDERLEIILGLALLSSAVGIAIAARRAEVVD